MTDENGALPELRDFAMVLMDLPQAQLDATIKLNEVIGAVRDTKKAGKLTVTFTVTVGKLDPATIEILPDVVSVIPKHKLKGRVFFPDGANNPTQDDPSQLWRGDDIREAPTFVAEPGIVKEAPKV